MMMSVTSLHICSHTLDYKESYVEIVFALYPGLYQLWRIPDPAVAHYANHMLLVTNSIIFSLVHSLVMIANVISNLNIGNSHLHLT